MKDEFQISITREEFDSFTAKLVENHHGRMQYRDGHKTSLNQFCVVRVEDQEASCLRGHISGPKGNNSHFRVFLDDAGQVFIHVRSEGPEGFNREKALRAVQASLSIMMKRMGRPEGIVRISTKNWRGYYLRNTAEKGVGKDGLKRFEEAVALGLISRPFMETCLEFGFTMLKCG